MRLLDMNPQKAEKDEDKNMWINVILDTKNVRSMGDEMHIKRKGSQLVFFGYPM